MVNIIIATLNAAGLLEKTLVSIFGKDKIPPHCYNTIVIDGGSSDNTSDVIASYGNCVDYFVSEPDRGIADAFNKGIGLCKPGYVYFIGAGDELVDSLVLERVTAPFDYKRDMLICGRVEVVDIDGSGKITKFEANFTKKSLIWRMSLPHQGLLTSTLFFQQWGGFDETCRFAMDYELLLRAYSDFPLVITVDQVVARWFLGGVGFDVTEEVLKEYLRIRLAHRVAPRTILYLIYAKSRLAYRLRKLRALGRV
ncbi:MAG: glycosyltransferase [Oceanospirillaceae bacterium]|nr:glycosyltransferase [Oceanospirillaceae bacterium]